MASQAELAQFRDALDALSAAAGRDFDRFWATLDPNDWAATRKELEKFWPQLIGAYGDMSATVGADLLELQADRLRLTPEVVLAAGVNADRANARMRWAVGTTMQRGNLLVLVDELVKQPGRSTFQDSAIASGGGWARVPTGGKTCEFCYLLASRGGVYSSKAVAKYGFSGKKYHGRCFCQPTLVRGSEDYPDGYNPDEYLDRYLAARAEAASGDPTAILAAARAQHGGTH